MLREGSVQEHSQLPLPIACVVRAWVGLSDWIVTLPGSTPTYDPNPNPNLHS
jgi:hypothetical protein